MDVCSQSDVVSEIPADVVRIRVDDDVVRIPEPAGTIIDIVRSHTEVKASEPEAIRRSSNQPIDVAASYAAGEMAMLPRMIQVIVRIIRSGIVPDPFSSVGVNVRSRWMTGLVAIARPLS